MRDLDAVVTLSSLLLPCRIDDPAAIAQTYDQQCRLVFNVTGTPAISVPTGFTDSGVPLAMQIAGRAFDEPMVYRDRAGLSRPRPGLPTGVRRLSCANSRDAA